MISKAVCAFVRGQGAHSFFAAVNLARFRNSAVRFEVRQVRGECVALASAPSYFTTFNPNPCAAFAFWRL
jgi:hypothetical protein